MKRDVEPDLVFTHHGLARRRDHGLIRQVTRQTFRDHMIWEYEIPKYDDNLTTPNMYVPLPAVMAMQNMDVFMRSFPPQTSKSWFTAENLSALMRMHGLESRAESGFAEAFHCGKLVLPWNGDA